MRYVAEGTVLACTLCGWHHGRIVFQLAPAMKCVRMFPVGIAAMRALALALMAFALLTRASAQCPTPPNAGLLPTLPAEKKARPEPILPEAGFLSNTHYTSQFFGFSFDLPLTVEGHQIMMPLMPEKRHALLALQFEQGRHRGSILVTADDPAPGRNWKIPEERQQELERWAREGTQAGRLPLNGVPLFMLRSGHFYRRITHRGRVYAAEYWAGINDYDVKILVATDDGDFLAKSKNALDAAKFYCPQDDGTLIDADGKAVQVEGEPYFGPTVPTDRVNAALREQPGKSIPLGEASDGVYRNPDIGFHYELPKGWKPLVTGAGDPPSEASALREYRFLHACSQTLLQAVPQQQRRDDIQAAIVLRALDPNCLSLRTATSLTDKRTTDEVAASLEQLREFGEIGSDALLLTAGHLFMMFSGTMPAAPRGSDLAPRLSQIMFATRYNKLLLVWTFLAPNTTSMAELPTGTVVLGDAPAIQLRTSQPQAASR